MSVQLEHSQPFFDFVRSFDSRSIDPTTYFKSMAEYVSFDRLQDFLRAWVDTGGENNAVMVSGGDWAVYLQAVVLIQNGCFVKPRLLDYNHGGVTYERDVTLEIDFYADEESGLPSAFDREYYLRRKLQLQRCRCPHSSQA